MSTTRIVLDSPTAGNGVSNDFTVTFSPGIKSKDYEIAVESITLSFSWFNISAALGNNQIGYKTVSTGASVFITIPDGEYGLDSINTVLQQGISSNGGTPSNIILSANTNTLTSQVTLSGGYCLDLTAGSLWTMLGFNSGIVITTQGITLSPNEANVTPVNTVLFHCSLVSTSYYNGLQSDIIATYSPNAEPGSLISITPNKPVYSPVTPDMIYSIRMYVTDDLGKSLNLQNQVVTYGLLLRPINRTSELLSNLIQKLDKILTINNNGGGGSRQN